MLQPLISDYKQAVLDAANSFKDLLPIRPILQQGEPKFAAGNFAVVFQVQKTDTEQLLAVKCFHRALPDRQERQQHIAAYLATHRPRYFVPYRYLHEELWVDTGSHAQDYPVVVMDWVEGKTLGETVKNYCQEGNTDALKDLLMKFCEMASYLLSLPIAHGDLKHDNILVTPAGELLLVDYDGMYVPSLQGRQAAELGGTDYQHPHRTATDYNAHIDDYAIAVIALSLAALAQHPDLYTLQKGENLLLGRQDFLQPFDSEILSKIEEMEDRYVQQLLHLIKNGIMATQVQLPTLDDLVDSIACPLTMEWWDGLLKYGSLKEAGLYIHTWQDVFWVHLALWEKGILLKGNLFGDGDAYRFDDNCFKAYSRKFDKTYLSPSQAIKPKDLQRLYQLPALWLRGLGIDSLLPLQEFKNLKELNCANNELSSLSGLENCVNLKELDFWCNQLTSLSGLENCVNLKELDCRSNQLSNLLGLENCVNLEQLDCSFNKLTSLSGIENCVNLKELGCSSNKLTSLSGLENCVNLKKLYCSCNQLTSLSGLENCVNLQYLVCLFNQLTNLSGLDNCLILKELNCSYNNLTSLSGLENCVNLSKLDCYHNQLTSLSGLENCVNLQYLECLFNQLTNLSGLDNCLILKELNCSYNNLTSLSGLENCVGLQDLYCYNEKLSNMEIEKIMQVLPQCSIKL